MWNFRLSQHGYEGESTTPKTVTDLQQVSEVVNLRVQFHLEEHPHFQHTHCPGNSSEASREPCEQAENEHRLFAFPPRELMVLAWSLCSLLHTLYLVGCFHCRYTFVSQLLHGVSGEKLDHGQNWAAKQDKSFTKGILQAMWLRLWHFPVLMVFTNCPGQSTVKSGSRSTHPNHANSFWIWPFFFFFYQRENAEWLL